MDAKVKAKIDLVDEKCEQVRTTLAEMPEATPHEAKRASAFALETSLWIARVLRDIKNEIILLEVKKTATYSKSFKGIDDKVNVSKAKAMASANPDHIMADVELKRAENMKEYFEEMFKVCENAHKFYKSQFTE